MEATEFPRAARTDMTTSAQGLQQSGGVEMRVHGVGDHGVFSALGKPV
jgi:hypothetical protein